MKKRVFKILKVIGLSILLLSPLVSCGNTNNVSITAVSGPTGPKGDKGESGLQGEKGDTGNGIASVEKTSSDGLKDIYTITFTDGSIATFTVTNGIDGKEGEQGIQGEPGKDGHTPKITIGENGNWFVDGEDTGIISSITGEKGDIGDKGDKGDKGDTGLSAYEIYMKYHQEYQGTEEDWINDLAECKLNSKVTISFDTDGGSTLNPIQVLYRTKIESIDVPIKRGFEFVGWKLNDEIIDINSYIFTESVTLTAEWNDIRVSVDSLYLLEEEDSYTVLGINEEHTPNITIPNAYDGKPITSIANVFFKNGDDIETLVFGKNIKTIESGAFAGCNFNVCFKGNVYEWMNAGYSFESSNVNVYYYSKEEPKPDNLPLLYWHYNEDGITPIIWEVLQYELKNNEYIVIGIGNCKGDVKIPEVYDGKKVTSINRYAFSRCDDLTSIEIPNSVTSIGEKAFFYCFNLTKITLPFIGDKLKNPSDTSIGYIFGNVLYNLKEIIITNATSICTNAFEYCQQVEKIEIPNTVTNIEASAFDGCSNLKKIIIPDSVTSIGESAFSNCGLEEIKLSNSITSIGSNTFSRCGSLKSIAIPNSVTSIGKSAFFDCTSLTNVEIPNSVTSIGESAFIGCSSLEKIELPNSITIIDSYTFKGCTSLISIKIPNSLTSIGQSAFVDCASLENIDLPNSITSIGQSAFENCYNLESIDIPNNVTIIALDTFLNCSHLTNVSIPNSVENICAGAFIGCSSLVNIIIPDSVVSVGMAFVNCTNLESIVIPGNLTSTNVDTFKGCYNLSTIYFKGTKEYWQALGYNFDSQSVTICYYSETKSADTDDLYWHYDTDGVTPILWQ